MSRWFAWLLIACLFLSTFAPAAAQDDDEGDAEEPVEAEEDFNAPRAAPVTGVTIFPEHTENRFAAGKEVEALIGLNNNVENTFNVEYIRGSVVSPFDPNTYVQNFSGALYNATVAGGEEHSLLYRFTADTNINPSDYVLILELFYSNDDNETFLTTVYNSTVLVTEPDLEMDARTVLAYVMILGMFGGALYVGLNQVNKNQKRAAPRGRKEEKAAAEATKEDTGAIDWDFISPQHAAHFKQANSRQNSTSPSRKGSSPKRQR